MKCITKTGNLLKEKYLERIPRSGELFGLPRYINDYVNDDYEFKSEFYTDRIPCAFFGGCRLEEIFFDDI